MWLELILSWLRLDNSESTPWHGLERSLCELRLYSLWLMELRPATRIHVNWDDGTRVRNWRELLLGLRSGMLLAIVRCGLCCISKRRGCLLRGRKASILRGANCLLRDILMGARGSRHELWVHMGLRPLLLCRHMWWSLLPLQWRRGRSMLSWHVLLLRRWMLGHDHGRRCPLVRRVLRPALLHHLRRDARRQLAWRHARVYPLLRRALVGHA